MAVQLLHDLTDINLAEAVVSGGDNWDNTGAFSSGGNPQLDDVGFIEGANAISHQVSTSKTGVASSLRYENSTSISPAADEVFFFWWKFTFPGALNDYNEDLGQTPASNSPGTFGGYFIGIGQDQNNYDLYVVGGANYGRYPYGGWQNVAIDPTRRTTPGANFVEGSPNGTFQVFAYVPNIQTAPARGQNNVADALRFGRGTISMTGGTPDGTFDDFATFNDSANARLGLFQGAGGGQFLYKGNMQLGTAGLSVNFTDANKSVTIDDTRQTYRGFNLIEVSNASSVVSLENITFVKLKNLADLGLDSARGDFQVNDNATLSLTGCSFTDMDRFTFNGNGTNAQTMTDTTFRRCNVVHQNGATFTSCDFERSSDSAALVVSDSGVDLNLVTGCKFTQLVRSTTGGAGNPFPQGNHAIKIADVCNFDKTVSFADIELNNYTAGSTGTFSGVSGTDSAAIEVNVASGVTLTINVTGTSDTPSIQNLGAGDVVVQQTVTAAITNVLGASEVKVLNTDGSPYSGNTLNDTLSIATERVSADIIVGNGTDYVSYTNNNGKVRVNANGSAVFSGVLSDGDIAASSLDSGDNICVFVRDDTDNPTLQLVDEFTVATNGVGQTTAGATSIDTTTDFATFTSVFDPALTGSNSKTVSVERKDSRFEFQVSSGQSVDFLVFRIGSDPTLITEQIITNDNRTFPINQTGDRTYRNPG